MGGSYVFRLTVTDDQGATGYDEATVVVNPAPPAAQHPQSHTGSAQDRRLPTP